MFTKRPALLLVMLCSLMLSAFVNVRHPGAATAAQSPNLRPMAYMPIIAGSQKAVEPGDTIYLGAYIQAGWAEYPGELREFEAATGKHHGIYHYYVDWAHFDWSWNKTMMDMIVANGSTPMITWMSIPNGGQGCGDPNWNLDSIINGAHDGYIRAFAQGAAAYGHVFFLRWGHEMNLPDYSWSGGCNGANAAAAAKFVAAFRHIHDLFREVGATNVKFVWSPNYESYPVASQAPWNDINNYYPGDAYVDWTGVVGYNWGKSSSNSNYRWMSFTNLFDKFLRSQATLHPSKPVMVADFASVPDDGGSKAQWILDAFHAMPNYPNLHAVVWFDYNVPVDFRVDSSATSLAAYRQAIQPAIFSAAKPYP